MRGFINKIIIHYRSAVICLLVFSTITFHLNAQHSTNKYGLVVISTSKAYKQSIKKDANKQMLDLRLIPEVVIDLAYTRGDNFMKVALYPPINTSFLRRSAITGLIEIQRELAIKGLGIKIWDAYRPYSVTEKMWEKIMDDRYAADPSKGSGHNKGIAVDLTLIDLATKTELNMGTGFDNFSDTAHHSFKDLPADVIVNRQLLRSVMERHGFTALQTEWWHYSFKDAFKYELLDISFRYLLKLNKKAGVR